MILLTTDIESTGLDPNNDRIVQLAVKLNSEPVMTYNFNPDHLMTPSAIAAHGITDDMVKDWPLFSSIAPELLKIFEAADAICGYRVDFDISFLVAEFQRCGLTFPQRPLIDPLLIWRAMEPRTLQDAYKKFVDPAGFDGAHTADADTTATYNVLRHMLVHFNITDLSYQELADLGNPNSNKQLGCPQFAYSDDGTDVLLTFGKHSGKSVFMNLSYLSWMKTSTFGPATKKAIDAIVISCKGKSKDSAVAELKKIYPFKKVG